MSWSITTRHMPYISSYEAAQAQFEKTEPWRGHTSFERPLGARYDKEKRLVMTRMEDDRCVYAFRLYRTDLVTYTHDRVNVVAHHTISSRAFMDRVLPYGIDTLSHLGKTFFKVRTPDGDEYLTGDDLWFRRLPHNQWQPECKFVTAFKEPTFDHKVGHRVRKLLAPFEQWHHAMTRLGVAPVQIKKGRLDVDDACSVAKTLLWDDVSVECYPHMSTMVKDLAMLRAQAYDVEGATGFRLVEPGVLPNRRAVAA